MATQTAFQTASQMDTFLNNAAPAPVAPAPKKANKKVTKKANRKEAPAVAPATATAPADPFAALPAPLPARCSASYNASKPMDATTETIFRYHLIHALAAHNGTATICQIYNYLRGDSPLRLEKDGSAKEDGLPRWSGLGSSKLFRTFTEGTYLTYTHKVCSNGRIRSVAVAGPLLEVK